MVIPLQSFANETLGIFSNLSTAKIIAGDINFYKQNKAENEVIINVLEEESRNYLTLSNEYKSKIDLLDIDKGILRTRGDKFENVYMSCSNSLVQCKEDTPSRYVWFSLGALTTIILGLTGIYLITK